MAAFFAKTTISVDRFAEEAFSALFGFFKDKERKKALAERLAAIGHLRDEYERERSYRLLWDEVQNQLLREQWRGKYGPEYLKEAVRKAVNPVYSEGFFPMLFLTDSLQRAAVSWVLLNDIFAHISESNRQEVISGEYITNKGLLQNGTFVKEKWFGLFQKSPPEELYPQVRILMVQLLDVAAKTHGALRTEMSLKDIWQKMKAALSDLDALAWLLSVIPESYLGDERLSFAGRKTLEKAVRLRTREAEETAAHLAGERAKLQGALQELGKAQEKLESLDRAKNEFIAVVSHQFRTPLSIIRWHTELLEDSLSDSLTLEAQESLSFIHEKCLFLIDILNNIYDILAVEGGLYHVETKPTMLWELVQNVLVEKEREISHHRVGVYFVKEQVPYVPIMVDQEKMQRVVEIILSNAFQYTPKGGEVRIAIEYDADKSEQRIRIQDSGIGIAESDLPKIFGKFFRAQNAIRMVPDGAGLGLYLAKKFAQMHEGDISISSILDKGSTFVVTIPVGESRLA